MLNLDSADPFGELASYDVILGYEVRDENFYEILRYLPDEYADVDLRESDRLKQAFMKHFKAPELPAVILKGSPILNNLEERMTDYLKEKDMIASEKLLNIIDPNLVTVFIKGSPTQPRCGFTKSLIEVLHGVGLTEGKFKHFDVLSDEGVRSKLKTMNNWPTFPQVYIKGKFIGGLDVIKTMEQRGKLKEKLEDII